MVLKIMRTWKDIIDKYLEQSQDISEIETNGTTSLFIKDKGKRVELPGFFENEMDYFEKTKELAKMVDPDYIGEENYDYPKFLVEGRLLLSGTSARVHIVLPPAADSPQVTIAKKTTRLSTLKGIKDTKSMNSQMYDFIKAAIACNQTIIVSGGTGSGKTTILEAMTREFNYTDRIGVVEDSPELKLQQPNVTYLHSTLWKPGSDKNSVATLSWCVQQINRQRTDKLIIGETRGKEFADFIIGANSGMEGSLTTIHANNPRLALQKMNQFISQAQVQATARTVNETIAAAIDIIIQLGFDKNGKNKIISITEVSDIINGAESAQIATSPLFTFDDEVNDWKFEGFPSEKLRVVLEKNNYDTKTFALKDSLKSSSIQPNRFRK